MKKLLPLLAAGIVASSSAHAAVYKFQYTSVIETLEAGPEHAEVPVASFVGRNADMRLGDVITGTFVIDTEAYGYSPIVHDWGTERSYGYGMLAVDMVIDRTGQVIPGTWTGLGVKDSHDASVSGDAVSVQGGGSYDGPAYEPYSFGLRFGSSSADILSSTAVPVSEFSEFAGKLYFQHWYTDPETHYVVTSVKAGGNLTSLTLLPVPEPGTYAMLLAGLGTLAWRRRTVR